MSFDEWRRTCIHKQQKCFSNEWGNMTTTEGGGISKQEENCVTDNCYDFALKLHNLVVITFHSFPSIEGELDFNEHSEMVKGGKCLL
jgi:hypothetical protein